MAEARRRWSGGEAGSPTSARPSRVSRSPSSLPDSSRCSSYGRITRLSGVVLIDNLNGTYEEPDFDLALIRFRLVLKREK
jgi:hypothetical protein